MSILLHAISAENCTMSTLMTVLLYPADDFKAQIGGRPIRFLRTNSLNFLFDYILLF